MKRILPACITLILVTSSSLTASTDAVGVPFYSQRPQGYDLARRMAGEVHFLTPCNDGCVSGALSGLIGYSRTFKDQELAKALTFNGATSMLFSGNPAEADIDPVNFLLPDDFKGIAFFDPNIENYLFDLYFRLNLDQWACGLYLDFMLPVAMTRWNVRLTDNANGQIVQAWKGQVTTATTPVVLNNAAINGRQTKTSTGDPEAILGYNFWCTDCDHFGINFRVSAPAGTRPDGTFFFEPVIGNGKHTEVGVGVSAHRMLWYNDNDRSCSLWFEGAVHHLLKTIQHRTFDLVGNGIGSRYLLIKRFNPDTFDPETGLADSTGELVRGPNVLTQKVKSWIGGMGQLVVLLNYQHCNMTFDIGYNMWGRTKEKLEFPGTTLPEHTYGVAGNTPADSSQTASRTRINGALADAFEDVPVFLTNSDIDLQSGAFPNAISHKLFAHLNYIIDVCDYHAFIGFGGSGEWSQNNNRALNQWAVWTKGGFAF